MASEDQIRLAVFEWLEDQTRFDDVLHWSTLQGGFAFQGRTISLVGQQGIWKPKVFKSIPHLHPHFLQVRLSGRGHPRWAAALQVPGYGS